MNSLVEIHQETHKKIIIQFGLVFLLFVSYFGFVTFQYGIGDGFLITWLTWSFFVLCTPLADAGFLIDLPLRLLLKVRMFVSELFVWIIAIILNFYVYFHNPEVYEKTNVLSLFKHILDHPIPFWGIIILSGVGTFLSVKFGDELLDVFKHRDCKYRHKHYLKWKLIVMIFIFLLILVVYDHLSKQLGIQLSF